MSGFGFKLDYDKAIAQDEADIEMFRDGGPTDRLARAARSANVPEQWDGRPWSPMNALDAFMAVIYSKAGNVEVNLALFVRTLGEMTLAEESAALWGVVINDSQGEFPDRLQKLAMETFPTYRSAWTLADATLARLERIPFMVEADRRRALKKAKVSLARHRRNKERWGR